MLVRRKILKLVPLAVGLFAIKTLTTETGAFAQEAGAAPATPQSPKVAAGEVDVKQLLLLMDTDKDGKISRKEFMDFMAAEFDRLDTDKSGELDVKELEKSQLTSTRHGGTRR
jgi:hypothetical protein